jgi:hypothetical protein
MPNYVYHDLTITGPEADRERFMAECFSRGDDNETNFDFDKLIPEPEHIKEVVLLESEHDLHIRADGQPTVELRVPAWYAWRCKNWGDKWNACDTAVAREGETIKLSFSTAWSPPTPIFREIARRFPTLKIEGSYLDGMYNFGGDILIQNGRVEFEDRTEEISRDLEARMAAAAVRH